MAVASAEPRQLSYASVDVANVTIETIKKAEASNDLVLRIFEHANTRATATITFGIPIKSVRIVNLMEEHPGEPLPITGNAVSLNLRPFEIATLLVQV